MPETLIYDRRDRVAVIRLNRPGALNALNQQLTRELAALIDDIDRDRGIAVSVLTGEGRAFAAGADIKEMASQGFIDMYLGDFFALWDRVAAARKPVIAAVNGFALGGGCELALMCDVVIASDRAMFGQPEIKLGVTPAIGGSIRLTKAVGKARAMDLILTGRTIDAAEAERIGMISRVVPHDTLMDAAMETAATMAGYPIPALMAAKEMVGRALEGSTAEGLRFERRLFHALFASEDQKEGMAAFVEKRPPVFRDR